MLLTKRLGYLLLGGLLALGIVFGGVAVFAQTDDGGAEPATPTVPTTPDSDPMLPGFNGRSPEQIGPRGPWGGDSEALAQALGMTVDELDAAYAAAREAAVAQAVADGTITQEAADAILAGEAHFPRALGKGVDDTYLAEALGITVEDLQAAQDAVQAAHLADMVESGAITQEQADLMLAEKAVQAYVDMDAINASIQAAYEAAVAQALVNGDITQAQADALLSTIADFNFGGHGGLGFDGPGGHGGRGPGGDGGHGFPGAPGASDSTAPDQSVPSTNTSTDA